MHSLFCDRQIIRVDICECLNLDISENKALVNNSEVTALMMKKRIKQVCCIVSVSYSTVRFMVTPIIHLLKDSCFIFKNI